MTKQPVDIDPDAEELPTEAEYWAAIAWASLEGALRDMPSGVEHEVAYLLNEMIGNWEPSGRDGDE